MDKMKHHFKCTVVSIASAVINVLVFQVPHDFFAFVKKGVLAKEKINYLFP